MTNENKNFNTEFQVFGKPMNLIVGFLVMLIIVIGLFRLATFVYNILWYIGPILAIAAALIDFKVIKNYVGWLRDLMKRNSAVGVLAILASIFAFPFVSAYWLFKALANKNMIKSNGSAEPKEGDYIKFEELKKDADPIEKNDGEQPL